MAKAAVAKKSDAGKKAPGTAVATLQSRLTAMAEDSASRAPADSTAMMIRLRKDKTFELPDGSTSPQGKPLRVVIVDHATGRGWFDRPYKEGEKNPPACAAGNLSGKDLVPYDNVPKKQSKDCDSCPYNQWGSAPMGGDGKACKEHRKLALLPGDNSNAPIMMLQVPPSSLKAYDAYVKNLAKIYQRPPVAYVTEISFDTTVDYQKLMFGNPQNLDDIEPFLDRVEEARELLLKAPTFETYEAPKAGKGRGGRV